MRNLETKAEKKIVVQFISEEQLGKAFDVLGQTNTDFDIMGYEALFINKEYEHILSEHNLKYRVYKFAEWEKVLAKIVRKKQKTVIEDLINYYEN